MKNEYIIRDEAMTIPVLPKEQRIRLDSVDEAFEEGWRQALENLVHIPAADVVEVVRCGQCKYCVEHYDTDGNAPYWTCKEWDSGTDYDGYCHYGERKDGGQDE